LGFTFLIKSPIQKIPTEEIQEEKECEACNDVLQTNLIALNQNIEECDTLSSPESINFCKTSLIMDKAMYEKDSTICDQLSGEIINTCKDNILLMQALDNQDENICNNILNENTKNLCLNSI